jgi:hypothetical protein
VKGAFELKCVVFVGQLISPLQSEIENKITSIPLRYIFQPQFQSPLVILEPFIT